MKTITLFILTTIFSSLFLKSDFVTEQKKFERVRTAIKEKEATVKKSLKNAGVNYDNLNILIKAYKHEQQLDVYAKNKEDKQYKKIISYKICALSGFLGPKREQGDGQVPEGFYFIDQFNPVSNFYLSLRVSYPNQADKKKSKASNLGGDIFIHGSCVTIGCMPMTDEKIKEIYLYAIQATKCGQLKIPVYIFPFKMTAENMKTYQEKYKTNKPLFKFWENLKIGYDLFETNKQELTVKVDNKGDYLF